MEYLNCKLEKGFKPKDLIQSFLVDSIVNSYILPENFKENIESEIKSINSAKNVVNQLKEIV
jgi:tripartite-type tricarboxylate transporter receptor subunit TctC